MLTLLPPPWPPDSDVSMWLVSGSDLISCSCLISNLPPLAFDSLPELLAPVAPGWESSSSSRAAASSAAICELSADELDRLTELLLMVVVLVALILLLLLLLVVVVADEEDAVVLVLLLPDDADVVVVGPLEAVLVMEAAVLLRTALSAGGVEIGMGDEMGGGGGVGSGAEAISADTFGVFGVLTGGG